MLNIDDMRFAYSREGDVVNIKNLSIPGNGLYAVIGRNGAGKTTLLKIIAGILKYRGSCKISGREVRAIGPYNLSAIRSYIPQAQSFSFDFTVRQFVRFGLYRRMNILSVLEKEHESRADAIMDMLQISAIAEHSVNRISGGELQKANIARAILQDAPMMLLDEPVSNIDIQYRFQIMKLLKGVSAERTVLYVTHDINTALNYSDSIISMKNGNIVMFGNSEATVKNFERIYDSSFRIENIDGHYVLIDEVKT